MYYDLIYDGPRCLRSYFEFRKNSYKGLNFNVQKSVGTLKDTYIIHINGKCYQYIKVIRYIIGKRHNFNLRGGGPVDSMQFSVWRARVCLPKVSARPPFLESPFLITVFLTPHRFGY